MKTLVFCTSWADSDYAWHFRYGKWLAQIRGSPLCYSQILLVDDASPVLPRFEEFALLSADALPADCPAAPVALVRFAERLGRRASYDYPGWWRSFMFVADYATRYGFDKIVHIESDTYVLSRVLYDYLNDLEQGWTAFWCPRWGFPETCIQVICPDQLPRFRAVAAQPYGGQLVGQPVEKLLPFTQVEVRFKGDRYGEYRSELPLDADYASQVPWSVPVWCGLPPAPRRVLALTLGEAAVPPNEALYLRDAWQHLANCADLRAAALLHALERLPADSVDALQVTVLAAGAGFSLPFGALRRVLGQDGELLINLRPSLGLEAAGALAQQLSGHGFAGVGLRCTAAGGDWILAASDNTALAEPLCEERLSLRLRLIAESGPGTP
jgi:hypothetical protein